MKNIILFLLVTLFFVGCKKDDPDPRDQYIGKYQLQTVTSTQVSGQTYSANTQTVLNVSKGTNTDELAFSDGQDNYTVKLSGTAFSIVKFVSKIRLSGTDYAFDVTGNGSFNGNNINYVEAFSGSGALLTATHTGGKQ